VCSYGEPTLARAAPCRASAKEIVNRSPIGTDRDAVAATTFGKLVELELPPAIDRAGATTAELQAASTRPADTRTSTVGRQVTLLTMLELRATLQRVTAGNLGASDTPSRNNALMTDPRDYRSARSESLEGSGLARARWKAFHDGVEADVWEEISIAEADRATSDEVPWEALQEINDSVIEESELIGFWVAWHLAGGFVELERAGWHRATIHRKIRHFRTFFGTHPDEYRHPWLKLDLEKAWRQRLMSLLHPVEEP
jgi:hypothetical protein